MRIYEIAPGEKRIIHKLKFKKMWQKLIIPHCSEILKIYSLSNKVLYRGIENQVSTIFRGTSRIDRKPRDSYLMLSELFELGLKHLGMTALRSNSIFAISDEEIAKNFGNQTFIIFPINGFEYTWTKHTDLSFGNRLNFKHRWMNLNVDEIIKQAWTSDTLNSNSYKPETWLVDDNFIDPTQSLETNIQNINNLLIKHNVSPIKPIDLIDITKFKDFFEPQNTGLLDMLKDSGSHNSKETLINGSYYAFNTSYYEYAILHALRQFKNSKEL